MSPGSKPVKRCSSILGSRAILIAAYLWLPNRCAVYTSVSTADHNPLQTSFACPIIGMPV